MKPVRKIVKFMVPAFLASCGSVNKSATLQDTSSGIKIENAKGIRVLCHGLGTTQAYGDVNMRGDLLFTDSNKNLKGQLYLDAYDSVNRVFKDDVEFEGMARLVGIDPNNREIDNVYLAPKSAHWQSKIANIELYNESHNKRVSYVKTPDKFIMLSKCKLEPIM
jgi:hypothetical protein